MKATRGLVWIVFLGLASCFNPPEYPNVPEIEFDPTVFVDVPDGLTDAQGFPIPDTLLLNVKFKDGDGDLGVLDDPTDNGGRYAERFYFNMKDHKKYYLPTGATSLEIAKSPDFIKYKTRRSTAGYDTLPAYQAPFTCKNWEIVYQTVNNITSTVDTVYFQLNPNHYNIFVDFLILKNDNSGDFEEYDFRANFCTTYDGRVPIIAKEQGDEAPLQGVIHYGMTGTGFKLIFGNRPMKLQVYVQDRALNRSNIITTDAFTLASITRK